jgi:predicted permease
MLTVLEVTLPVFALVLCGWLSARRRLLSEEAVEGINAFVFWFALPAMLLRAVSAQPVSQIADARFLLAYLAAAMLMFFVSRALAAADGADRVSRTGLAFAASHGNIGYLGLPLLAQLGDPSRLPAMVMAIVVDILVVIVMSIVLFEFARSHGGGDEVPVLRRVRGALGGLLRTPLILGIAAGLVLSVTGITLPVPAATFVDLLASAAGPCALFAIGASLGARRVSLERRVGGLLVAKLIVHPALVAGIMALLGVDARLAAIGVLAAALPTASNAFILSQRYGVDTRPIGAAIVAGTFISAATVSLVIWLLGLPIG